MSEDEFECIFRRYRCDAILLHRPYPPHRARRTNSKFGGLPRLPTEIEWPRTPGGIPLHFLAQIDCADLPNPSALPNRGVLFFFGRENDHHLWDHESSPADVCRVLHVPEVSASTPLRQAPSDLPPIGGRNSPHGAWGNIMRVGENAPSLHVEWPIEPLASDDWPDALPQAVEESDASGPRAPMSSQLEKPCLSAWPCDQARQRRYSEALVQRRERAIARAIGIAIPDLAGTRGQDKSAGREIFFHAENGAATYPQHWLTIRYAARFLLRQLDICPYPEAQFVARLWGEANAWLNRDAAVHGNAPVEEQDRGTFRAWLRSVRLSGDDRPLSDDASRLVFLSMLATIRCWAGETENAARITPQFYDSMAFAFRPFSLDRLRASRMLGYARTWQPPAHRDDPIVGLLQLASDSALGWQWGDIDHCGFWIATSDLARRDFSRAWLTIEGG
ncbi:DUF1963 domain-containing protein [Sphingosinicella sp. BN140058]|uniref:DUF1963 domain-containing protein n=1 Tax=Sphingosinicella sp. BN140058 TaxID=1892855 RepID=UPI00101010D0|nr:DUF1963 domain-containing protein [Sphingosinicella sp. BN140058]QAY75614.1 DUF1963 domain-containing protein [Sphingosinicella sp. BN140058]